MLDVTADGAPGIGAEALAGGGAASVAAARPDAIAGSGPADAERFDLIVAAGGDVDAGTLLDSAARSLADQGVLVLALGRLIPLPGEPTLDSEPTLAAVVERFGEVRVESRALVLGSRAGEAAAAAAQAGADSNAGALLVAASREPLPPLEPVAALEEPEALGAVFAALSAWEERARADEAEMAATRWEGRASAEKLTAVVNRLYELENSPARRLLRRLRGGPGRATHQGILRRASADRPPDDG